MSVPILSLKNAMLSFGGRPLFENLSLSVSKGQKICLVGRNGCGKSSLLKVLASLYELDKGDRFVQPGTQIHYLQQDPTLPKNKTIGAYLEPFAQETYQMNMVLSQLKMDPTQTMEALSGGEMRRVALAQTLMHKSDVLLLDEPTNHLDVSMIEWLEDYMKAFRGGLVLISHDRQFLKAVSQHTWWLDRGQFFENAQGFQHFEAWSETILHDEERHMEKVEARLRLENVWLQRGVTARRKRNQGRLRALHVLRAEKKSILNNQHSKLNMQAQDTQLGSAMVMEAKDISLRFDHKQILKNFSTRIIRGDRIGVIGPNGAGKSTLLNVLLGRQPVDSGTLQQGETIQVVYFDQMRQTLDPNKTLVETLCPQGGDQVSLDGVARHVFGYLKDFLFVDAQIQGKVGILSGGEKNRLSLAMALAQPSNLLVLDEPTNDLDMETLDLLVELLSDYKGTLIIVSHDRYFLDQLTTSIIAVEGNGVVEEYVGGFDDYIRQRTVVEKKETPKQHSLKEKTEKKQRLSYQQKRDLEILPTLIEQLELEIKNLEEKLCMPDFYQKNPTAFNQTTAQLNKKKDEKDIAETRWLELIELTEA
jgi:ATP-binding cassette subfamily F protein uup